jgi:hypothetical protein
MRTLKIAMLMGAVLAMPLAAQRATTPPARKPTPVPLTQEQARQKAEQQLLLEKVQAHLLDQQHQEQLLSQKVREQLFDKQWAEHALSQKMSEQLLEQQWAEHALSQKMSEQLFEKQWAEHALTQKVSEQMLELQAKELAQSQQLLQKIQKAQKPAPRGLFDYSDAAMQHALNEQSYWHRLDEERAAELSRELDGLTKNGPRASWAQQDPADSLWRAARTRFNRGEFNEAMRLFSRIRNEERYARSTYRPDAYYYEAFSLSRMGSEDNLRQAQHILSELIRQVPAPQRHTDTNSLLTTIQARLAQSYGSVPAAAQVRALADEVRYASTAMPTVVTNAANLVEAVTAWPTVVPPGQWAPFASSVLQRNPQCANEAEIRLIALNALVRMDSTAAMPVLREVMARRDECAPVLRERALMIVSRIKSPEAETMLFDAARNDPDLGIRQSALVWLSTNNPDRAISIAEERLRGSQTSAEQEWALDALGRMRNERAWRAIRDYAARTDLGVEPRRRAIIQLAQSRDSTNATFLRDLYGRVGNERELKEAIIMSSAGRRSAPDANWLMGIALNEGEDVRLREYALNLVSRSTSVPTDRFSSLYDRATERRLKSAALRALSERARSDAVATEKIIAIARNETDIELRKVAVTALVTVNDPRARELLMEILRR